MSDIQRADGILLINLTNNTEDKSIKTPAGNRTVPLHPKILQLGFLDYVEMIKNGKQRKLFPKLKKMEKHNTPYVMRVISLRSRSGNGNKRPPRM